MRKKILLFLQSGVGGAERVTVTIGKNLNKDKFEVSFCSVGVGKNTIADFIPSDYAIDQIKTKNPIKQIYGLYKKIKNEKPDIVFASVININTKLLMLKPLFPNLKFVIRSDNNFGYFSKIHQWMIKLTYKHAQKIIAQTQEMKEGLIQGAKINTNKITVFQNPVDTSYIEEKIKNAHSPFSNNGNYKIVASGRFAPAKGFDILIEAFHLLKKCTTNIELFIIGQTGGDENLVYLNIKRLIDKYKLNDCIHCVGYKSNPYPYIKHANCFVLSSRAEGLPNVLLEALYLHTPIAATKCIPIISRLIHEGEHGFLAEPENPESLAEAMKKCLNFRSIYSNYDFVNLSLYEKIFE